MILKCNEYKERKHYCLGGQIVPTDMLSVRHSGTSRNDDLDSFQKSLFNVRMARIEIVVVERYGSRIVLRRSGLFMERRRV